MLTTARLTLRPFAARDHAAFSAINGDPEVMRFFPQPYTAAETARQLTRFAENHARDGFAIAAIERRVDGALIGMCGLSRVPDALPCAPAVEIGWRLARAAWGQGYATEAARAWRDHGFATLGLNEIVAFAPAINAPSLRVMARLGMARDSGADFRHPRLDPGSPLSPMALCRIDRATWLRQEVAGPR